MPPTYGAPPVALMPSSTALPCWEGPASTCLISRRSTCGGRPTSWTPPRHWGCAVWWRSARARSSTPPGVTSARTRPLLREPSPDPYTVTKMAAFQDAMARAAAGVDVVTTHPGAIYGPSPVASNALGITSFNRVLLSALRGRITQYLTFPVSWVFADDVARGCILALDRGVAGERYLLDGRPEDEVSTADACNRICELSGLDHRVVDVAPSDDPALAEVFGPTLVAIAFKLAAHRTERGELRQSKTFKRLGYDPIGLDAGLQQTARWMRAIGKVSW